MGCAQVAKTLAPQISQHAQVVLQTLAYAGTGDVLQVQAMLAIAGEHAEPEDGAAWKVRARWLAHPINCMAPWQLRIVSVEERSQVDVLASEQASRRL